MDPDGRITTMGTVTPAMFNLLRQRLICSGDFTVLAILKALADDNGECTVTNTLLTKACDCSLIKIKKNIAKLKEVGAIRRKSWQNRIRTLEILI